MTTRGTSLRRRVTWASALLGLVISLLFAGAVVLVTEDYEAVLAHEILRGQAEDYSLRVGSGVAAQLPRTQRLSGYRGTPPPQYANYTPGVHEDPEHDGVHVGVFDTSAGRLYFVIDLGDIEVLEQHLNLWLAAVILGGVALSGWLGWMFGGRALAPVRQLATAVDALTDKPGPSDLASTLPPDELGALARAIDDYQGRLTVADAQQQSFFADASHELRTPIAVVQGAAEVLLDDPELPVDATARVARLERGAQELADLTEAMFAVARDTPVRREALDMSELAREAWAAWPSASQPVTIRTGGAIPVVAARRETVLLLRMIARRAFANARCIGVDAVPGASAPATNAIDAVDAATEQAVDIGGLSALLRRTASRGGWRVHTGADGVVLESLDSRTRVRLHDAS
ncbi:sensor histidine kinase [Lysobacter claricitrinus]|uniref:sensor histidine kinase n=1 Tax=Lysobacter claricitrinus TaxID=3367728 RepID=UPI0037DBE226